MTKHTKQEKAKALINWSKVSEHLAGNTDSIRVERIPKKYKEEVEELLFYVECWLNCKDLASREDVTKEVKAKIAFEVEDLINKLRKIGDNPLI